MPKSRYPTPPGASTSISDPPLFPGPPLAPTTPTKISDVNSPRTPVHLALLGRVDEHPLTASAGSRAPLLAKDFAQRNPKSYSLGDTGLEEEGNEASSASFVELDVHASPLTTSVPSIQSLDEKEKKAIDPNLIPPPSIHDAYLSKFITPITPTPPADRPNIVRASSAPGAPHSALLPSALSEQGHEIEGKPIFEIFNAELNTSAEDMVKVLKGHLEGVLKMQDEIGNMHLGLEGLDLTGEAPDASTGTEDSKDRLSEREKGVDEIMERLGLLSNQLRTYHHLGTPKLSFPKSKSGSDSHRNKPRTQSINRTMNASTSSPTSSSFQPSPSSIHMSPNSPALPVHRSQSSQATSRSPPIPVHALTPEKPGSGSNLQAIHPREDQASLPPRRDADREDEREYLGTGAEAWYGYTPRDMNQAGRGTGARGMMGWIDSPMELTDRSRPW